MGAETFWQDSRLRWLPFIGDLLDASGIDVLDSKKEPGPSLGQRMNESIKDMLWIVTTLCNVLAYGFFLGFTIYTVVTFFQGYEHPAVAQTYEFEESQEVQGMMICVVAQNTQQIAKPPLDIGCEITTELSDVVRFDISSGTVNPGTPLQSFSNNVNKKEFTHYNNECAVGVHEFKDVYFVGESLLDWFGINSTFDATIDASIFYKCFKYDVTQNNNALKVGETFANRVRVEGDFFFTLAGVPVQRYNNDGKKEEGKWNLIQAFGMEDNKVHTVQLSQTKYSFQPGVKKVSSLEQNNPYWQSIVQKLGVTLSQSNNDQKDLTLLVSLPEHGLKSNIDYVPALGFNEMLGVIGGYQAYVATFLALTIGGGILAPGYFLRWWFKDTLRNYVKFFLGEENITKIELGELDPGELEDVLRVAPESKGQKVAPEPMSTESTHENP